MISENTKKLNKQGYIYIISNKYYLSQHIVKISKATSIKSRLSTINTTHSTDPFVVLDEFEVYNPNSLEKIIHELLSCYRCKVKVLDEDKADKKSLKEFFWIGPKKSKYLKAFSRKNR
jgi:hypothetical protein